LAGVYGYGSEGTEAGSKVKMPHCGAGSKIRESLEIKAGLKAAKPGAGGARAESAEVRTGAGFGGMRCEW
jgi:hypothetical protein